MKVFVYLFALAWLALLSLAAKRFNEEYETLWDTNDSASLATELSTAAGMSFKVSDYKWTERLFKKNTRRARSLLKAIERVIDEEDYERMKKYYTKYVLHAYRAMESYSEALL